MITKIVTKDKNEKAYNICHNVAFEMSQEGIETFLQSGNAVTQIIVLNTVDRMLATAQGSAWDFVSDILRTQDSKVTRFGKDAKGLSEKQAAVIAREIINRRGIANALAA